MKIEDLNHKHVLFNAVFEETPFKEEHFTCDWILKIVDLIGMEILYKPIARRCDHAGNEGISAFCLITTSHLALHSWEKTKPNFIQFDIYSCKSFDHLLIVSELKELGGHNIGCSVHNRGINNTKGWRMVDENLL